MALYQDKIRMVAALPQMRYNPPTPNISQSVDRAIAREDAYNKIALAEQSQREREEGRLREREEVRKIERKERVR